MNALHRIAFRIRAWRINLLRAIIVSQERAMRRIEGKNLAALGMLAIKRQRLTKHGSMATRIRPPVPEFLRRGRS